MSKHIALHLALWGAAALAGPAAMAQTTATTTHPSAPAAAAQKGNSDRVEKHIKSLHDQLKITAAEESQWTQVAQTMRDNAAQIDDLIQKRDDMDSMTAVDDLNTYAEITQANSDGVKKLSAVFTPLYTSMSDEQKKNADKVFSQGQNRHVVHNKKAAPKKG